MSTFIVCMSNNQKQQQQQQQQQSQLQHQHQQQQEQQQHQIQQQQQKQQSQVIQQVSFISLNVVRMKPSISSYQQLIYELFDTHTSYTSAKCYSLSKKYVHYPRWRVVIGSNGVCDLP